MRHQPVVGLDLLRCAAALLVCVYHYFHIGRHHPDSTLGRALQGVAAQSEWESFARTSFVGVEIFFVISGFVISFSSQRSTPWQFFQSRIERLLPAAWVCSTLTLLVLVATGNPVRDGYLGAWLRAFFLIPRGPWIDGAYWTLAVELVFYAIVCLLLAAGRARWLMPVMGLVGSLGTALACWMVFTGDVELQLRQYTLFTFVKHGAAFALGCFICLIARDGLSLLSWRTGLAGVFAIGTALEIQAAAMADPFNQNPAGATLLFTLLLLLLLLAVAGNGWCLRHLSPRAQQATRVLGIATYPFYLLHNYAGATLFGALAVDGALDERLAALVTVIVVMGIGSDISRVAEPTGFRVIRWIIAPLRTRLSKVSPAA
ncbi:acyltransferase [soil metagenome]